MEEWSEVVSLGMFTELIRKLWYRRRWFNSLVSLFEKRIAFSLEYFQKYFIFCLDVLYFLFLQVYLCIYTLKSTLAVVSNLLVILLYKLLYLFANFYRGVLILSINLMLFAYRRFTIFGSAVYHFFVISARVIITVFFIYFVINPVLIFLLNFLTSTGGIFIAYFYLVWVPLLFMAGIYEDWTNVLYRLEHPLLNMTFWFGIQIMHYFYINFAPEWWAVSPEGDYSYQLMIQPITYNDYCIGNSAGWFAELLFVLQED
jgi:hypothetical protein